MSDEPEYGPAMAALTTLQRGFVLAMVQHPGITQGLAAQLAGYQNSPGGFRVKGCHLAHDPGIQAAIREEAGKRLNSMSLLAANVMMDAMTDPDVPIKERLKAASAVLDRTGFGAAQTINVNKTTTDRTGAGMLERIRALAASQGLDPMKLLGANVAPVIEAEFSEVKQGETE